MTKELIPGLSASITHTVEKNFLASEIGSGLVNVFSSAMMVAFMEEAAVAAVQSYLPSGYTTVGVHLDISHSSATPLGMKVHATALLKEISSSGKRMTFEVSAFDEIGLIGSGIHQRVLVNWKDFESGALKKLQAASESLKDKKQI